MMADDAPSSATETVEETAEDPAADTVAAAPEAEPEPAPDPGACKAVALGLDALWEGVLGGEWDDTEFDYYLEPAGVINGPLVCSRSPEGDLQRGGLLMTRAGWQAKTLYLDDGVNPETYELSFPKEFGYVKPLAHYKPETRKDAKYPWSKRY